MSSVNSGRSVLLVLLLMLCIPLGQTMSSEGPSPHVDIWLRNEAGDRITPSDNAADPYSPRKTCGACHQYATITKGYHFRMGSPGEKADRRPSHLPPELFPGQMKPLPYRGAEIYDWIAGNAFHHPGGGPMEEIRIKKAGTAVSTDLNEAERLSAAGSNPDFASRSAPDRRSHFRESGALEADCFMCHMTGYRLDRRNVQIAARNYRWAPTAGSGLGEVQGRVLTLDRPGGSWEFSRRPTVRYYWHNGRFTPEGKLSGRAFMMSVPSGSCLQCHAQSQAFHTGTLHRADDDAHVKAGFRCIDCHGLASAVPGGRLSHDIGRIASESGRDRTGMSTCRSCHLSGQYSQARSGMPLRAPDPRGAHEEKFATASFHLRLLDCNACHVSAMPAMAAYLFDASKGNASWYTAEGTRFARSRDDASKPAREPWKPWLAVLDLKRGNGERYVPVNLHTAQWFGERSSQGNISSLDPGIVAGAYERAMPLSRIRVKDTKGPYVLSETAATPKDIEKMLLSLRGAGIEKPVFIADKVYELKKGKMVSSEDSPGNTLTLPISHGVSSIGKRQTLGANGCTDCHQEKAAFFRKMRVKNIGGFLKEGYPVPKEPNAYPQMLDWGFEEVPSHE